MSRTTSGTIQPTSNRTEAEELVWPKFNPSPVYRNFIERLRLARLERGLSIADMSDAVGLTFSQNPGDQSALLLCALPPKAKAKAQTCSFVSTST